MVGLNSLFNSELPGELEHPISPNLLHVTVLV